jgi:putative hydrolase of the HAD superfamily
LAYNAWVAGFAVGLYHRTIGYCMRSRIHQTNESSAATLSRRREIDAVLFDLGDTLIHYPCLDPNIVFEDGARITYHYLVDRGHQPPTFKRYRRRLYWQMRWQFARSRVRGRDFNSVHVLRDLCRGMDLPADDASVTELAWQWYSPLERVAHIEPELIPTLDALRSAGVKLGIVSNTVLDAVVLDRHLERLGLLDFFPVRVYSSETTTRKPHRRIFNAALSRLNVDAQAAMFVGDRLDTDIAGARRVGMRTVLKPRSNKSRGPAPDFTIGSVGELMPIVLGNAMPAQTN